jgi:hypothetical protein
METLSFALANVFRDNTSVLMALLVFLATGTIAFAAMAFVRVRGAVKRRTSRLMFDSDRAAKPEGRDAASGIHHQALRRHQ